MWPGQPMTAHWGVPDPAAERDVRARFKREPVRRLARPQFADREAESGCEEDQIVVDEIGKPKTDESQSSYSSSSYSSSSPVQ